MTKKEIEVMMERLNAPVDLKFEGLGLSKIPGPNNEGPTKRLSEKYFLIFLIIGRDSTLFGFK